VRKLDNILLYIASVSVILSFLILSFVNIRVCVCECMSVGR